jgi:hypothetical protein
MSETLDSVPSTKKRKKKSQNLLLKFMWKRSEIIKIKLISEK